MALDDFNSHQPVERAIKFMPSQAIAMIVFTVALVVDLGLLSLVWAHVFDALPDGIQGFFLIVLLGSFLGGLMSWKADKIGERFEDNLPGLLDVAIAKHESAQAEAVQKLGEAQARVEAEVAAARKEVADLRREFAEAVTKITAHADGFPGQVGRDIAALEKTVQTLRKDHDELSEDAGRKRPANVTSLERRTPVNGS